MKRYAQDGNRIYVFNFNKDVHAYLNRYSMGGGADRISMSKDWKGWSFQSNQIPHVKKFLIENGFEHVQMIDFF